MSEPHELTKIEDHVVVNDWAVVFRSKLARGVVIGTRAYVDGSPLVAGPLVSPGMRATLARYHATAAGAWAHTGQRSRIEA